MNMISGSDAAPAEGLAGRIEARRKQQATEAASKAAAIAAAAAEQERKAAKDSADEAARMPNCVAVVERMTPALSGFFKECAKSPDFEALFGSEPGAYARSANYAARLDLIPREERRPGGARLAPSDYRPCAMLIMGEGKNHMMFLATEVERDGTCMMALGLFHAQESDSKRNPFGQLVEIGDNSLSYLGSSMMSEFVSRVSPGGEEAFFAAAADSMADAFTSGQFARLAKTRPDGENQLGRQTFQASSDKPFIYVRKLNGLCVVYGKPENAVADTDGKFTFNQVGVIGEDDLAAAQARGETPPPVLTEDNQGENPCYGVGDLRRRLSELQAAPAPAPEPAPGA